jgi:hypothetical protein
MHGPPLLPLHLATYESCKSDEELFQALIQKKDDLILYFESACENEGWAKQHSKFLRLILRWGTKQFYLENLSLEDARLIVRIIQKHFSLLQPYLFFKAALFFTVRLNVENREFLVNSLLFGVCSPTLRSIFKHECFEKLNDQWIFFDVHLSTFRLIEIYVSKGEISELGTYDHAEIVDLMKQAKEWELDGLVKDCASVLNRSIQFDND